MLGHGKGGVHTTPSLGHAVGRGREQANTHFHPPGPAEGQGPRDPAIFPPQERGARRREDFPCRGA